MNRWVVRTAIEIEEVVDVEGDEEPAIFLVNGESVSNFLNHGQRFLKLEILSKNKVGDSYVPRAPGWH